MEIKDSISKNICQEKNGKDRTNEDKSCKDYDCPHNIFWSVLFEKQHGQEGHWKPTPSPLSESIGNCECRLDGEATIKEIADTYGITFQGMAKSIERALKKCKSRLKGAGINC